MIERRFIISDAAKRVDVESHVLRYWEEELDLNILRNEMGHRYYTEDDIKLFCKIKELKEQGFQLKAIKMIIPELKNNDKGNMDNLLFLKEELNNTTESKNNGEVIVPFNRDNLVSRMERERIESDGEVGVKMQQFKKILGNCIGEALKENNTLLGKEISGRVSESILKEMDYLSRLNDEKEEERYKKLDETIRSYQKSRQEIAVAGMEEKAKKKKKRKITSLFIKD